MRTRLYPLSSTTLDSTRLAGDGSVTEIKSGTTVLATTRISSILGAKGIALDKRKDGTDEYIDILRLLATAHGIGPRLLDIAGPLPTAFAMNSFTKEALTPFKENVLARK